MESRDLCVCVSCHYRRAEVSRLLKHTLEEVDPIRTILDKGEQISRLSGQIDRIFRSPQQQT